MDYMLVSMVFGYACAALVALVLYLYVHLNMERDRVSSLKSKIDKLEEKSSALKNDSNTRETLLRRGLEDLAFAEIDRARFILEVVYGK